MTTAWTHLLVAAAAAGLVRLTWWAFEDVVLDRFDFPVRAPLAIDQRGDEAAQPRHRRDVQAAVSRSTGMSRAVRAW
jgi:hypothetical protein